MQNREQRAEERIALNRPPKGELQLLVGKNAIRVAAVKDISAQGLRVQIGESVAKNQTVCVRFRHESVDLQVNGTVAWTSAGVNEPAGDGGAAYIVGINLVSPMLLHAFL
jgi:hypothetical protein